MLAQCFTGGESLTTQPKDLTVSIDNPASFIYFQRLSAFYDLRTCVKPPYLVSWFHFSLLLKYDVNKLTKIVNPYICQ